MDDNTRSAISSTAWALCVLGIFIALASCAKHENDNYHALEMQRAK